MRSSPYFTRRSTGVLIVLLIAAALLSVASYEYSSGIAASAATLSLDQIHSTSQIEASDLSTILGKSLEDVSANLQVVAHSEAVSAQNTTAASPLFASAQNSTKSLTFAYFWLDKNGLLDLVSNGTTTAYAPGTGQNLSARAFFSTPKETGETYFSSATQSVVNDSVGYIFISVPVYVDQSGSPGGHVFDGVVSAAIYLRTLGSSLKADLSPQFKSSIGLLDFKGTILYTGNASAIGENVFSTSYQSSLPSGIKSEFDTFLNASLSGQAGYQDISFKGASGTLAYQPVIVNATTETGTQVPIQFGVLYVVAGDSLAAGTVALIDQTEFVGVVMILGISGTSAVIALFMLSWNKRLDDTVKKRTAELSMANEFLDAKARAERDLMNITAHELRTPTQSILANTEVLRSVIRPALGIRRKPGSPQKTEGGGQIVESESLVTDLDPREIVEIVESSYRNARRLQNLTNNILEAARIENKTIQFEEETFDLDAIAKEIVDDRQLTQPNREEEGDGDGRGTLILSYDQGRSHPPLLVEADRTKVSEVLGNLLDNAAKFSHPGGRVTVTTDVDETGRSAVVRVKDEGSGVDPEIRPKLFEKFATKTGTGLGLYISRANVEAMGGKLILERDGQAGATFAFTLPLANPAPGKASATK